MANEYPGGNKENFIQNYFSIDDRNLYNEEDNEDVNENDFFAFQEPYVTIPDPKISMWEFLSKEELEELFQSRNSDELKKYLGSIKLERFQPKGKAKRIFLDLMYSVAKFCQNQCYSIEKCGVLMSQFYLTHIMVATSFDKSAEKVYTYFKELSLCATLPDFPPKNAKIFSHEETKRNIQYFTQIYLRILPLIRFLCLPNFAFYFNYYQILRPQKLEKDKGKNKKGKK